MINSFIIGITVKEGLKIAVTILSATLAVFEIVEKSQSVIDKIKKERR